MKRFGISGLALTLALGAWSGLHAQDEPTAATETGSIVDENADGIDDTRARRHRGRRGRGPGMGQGRGQGGVGMALTAEQQEALKATVDELKAAGATREEIHAAVGEKLESFGVELPQDWAERPALDKGNGPRFGGLGTALTEEQQEALKATVDELKAAGATREEIHATVGEKLESFGVELPQDWAERPALGKGDGQGNGKGKAKGVRGRGRHGRGPGRRGTPAPAPAPEAEPEPDSGF